MHHQTHLTSLESSILSLNVDEVKSLLVTDPLLKSSIDWDKIIITMCDMTDSSRCIEILSLFDFTDRNFRRSSLKIIMERVSSIDRYPVLQHLAGLMLRMAFEKES